MLTSKLIQRVSNKCKVNKKLTNKFQSVPYSTVTKIPDIKHTQLFINGKFVDAKSGKTLDVYNPSTGKVITQVAAGEKEDIDIAVEAARNVAKQWRNYAPSERSELMHRFANLIEKNLDYLERLESLDNGKPLSLSKIDMYLCLKTLRYYAGWCDKTHGKTIPLDGDFMGYTLHEPYGVCGQIVPWNFPCLMMFWKICPALATGNTIVLKPAEQTPLGALVMAQLAKEAGLPDGVLNIVNGYGEAAGKAIAHHMDIDKVAFTGSTEVGKAIQVASGQSNLKSVSLELGGKSPLVVLDDINTKEELEKVVDLTTNVSMFFNQGQVCTASSRVYVHSKMYDSYVEMAEKKAKERKVGNPFEASTEQGPQVSQEQFDTIMKYINIGKKEATLVTGGKRVGSEGYFIEPTIFANCDESHTTVKEEIFGPVYSLLKYDDVDEAIERANNSSYGLAAGCVSNDINKVMRFVRYVQAGTVWCNTYHQFQPNMPFGGYKQSGIGRDLGEYALSNYTQIKSVYHHIPNFKQ